VGPALATAGLGWYYDLDVQYLRMVFSGVFDRHPGLQVIAGALG
jgi:phage shock protein PspC (stress-responsive transcriptional regulator)